jgi:Pyruvate/2-oxoacid:ferredoxin oxidoreductase gamma subunit
MVILAAGVALTGAVSRETLVEAVGVGVGSRFKDLNLRALDKGFALGEAARGGNIGVTIPIFAVKG